MSGHQGFVLAASFDSTGRRLYTGSIEGAVDEWDGQSARRSASIACHTGPINDTGRVTRLYDDHEDWVRTLRVSADGRRLLSVSQNVTACLYDFESGNVTRLHRGRPLAAADFDATDQVCAVTAQGEVLRG